MLCVPTGNSAEEAPIRPTDDFSHAIGGKPRRKEGHEEIDAGKDRPIMAEILGYFSIGDMRYKQMNGGATIGR